MTQKLLDDITVLDLSQALAAPYATAILSDFGAEIINIEPPSGGSQRELLQGTVRPNVLRNKRSIIIDLKSEESDEIMEELVTGADVLIHNNRPGVMERLGYDYESMKNHNKSIIYCSLTAYGESGPHSQRAGYDPLIQAVSGMMAQTGYPDRKPVRVGASPLDCGTGLSLALSVLLALWRRSQTGEGGKIETSLMDTAASFMGYWYSYYSRYGETQPRRGHSWWGSAPTGLVETKDKPLYILIGERYWERFCEILGKEEWTTDPRYKSNEKRLENHDQLLSKIESETKEYESDVLLEELLEEGIPAGKLQPVEDAVQNEQLKHRDMIKTVEDTDGKSVKISGNPIKIDGESTDIQSEPPKKGEHTREILSQVGFDRTDIDKFISKDVVESN